MRILLLLPLLLALSGCVSPRQVCEARATRDLRVVEGLIGELEATLRRGYALDRQTVVRRTASFCRTREGRLYTCFVPSTRTRAVPAAVDLAEARETLASLVEKRSDLRRRATRDLATCRASYPPR